MMSSKTESSPQTEKSKKYDRQLRLWGDEGQSLIESANVCVIGAGATGCEILKNTILPSIGSFTLLDDHIVTNEDVSTNFFLDFDSVGQNRGKIACKYLLELNEDVRGGFVEESLQQVLDGNPKFFHSFSLVVATDVRSQESLIQLSDLLFRLNIPLIVTKIIGLFAYVRLQLKEHVIIESKPDSVLEDLRLDDPPSALISFCHQQDFNSMDRKDFTHVPYLVILYKYLEDWRRENGRSSTDLPTNYKEKDQLKTMIKTGLSIFRKKFSEEDDRELDITNWEEAIKAVNMVLNPSSRIPSDTKDILSQQTNDRNDRKNKKFWLMVRALDQFVKERGSIPLRGSIPDMTSDSKRYISLQTIYSQQAKVDAEQFSNILSSLSDDVEFTASEISTFCKNAHCLRVIRTGSLCDEYSRKGGDEPIVITNLRQMITADDVANDRESILSQYLLFRAVDDFYKTYQRLPGIFRDQQEEDVIQLKSALKRLLSQIGISYSSTSSREDLMQAFVSFGGSEIHSVAAFIGGIVGQEVIKVLTNQFVPLDHTLIYNAITCLTQTVHF